MNDIKKLKEQQKDAHPGFGPYLECMTRALFTGVAAFSMVFASTYFSQKMLQKKLPYGQNMFVLVSSFLAVGVSYHITARRTESCQAGWMAAEDKCTYLTENIPDED